MSKLISLTKGKFAIVDDVDYEWLNQWRWFANKPSPTNHTWYAVRTAWDKITKKHFKIKMHREILGTPKDLLIDHINHNGLDNRRENLRVCTKSVNALNTRRPRGVYWEKQMQKWRAGIKVNGKSKHLGFFSDKTEAMVVYNSTKDDLLKNPEVGCGVK